MGDILYLIVRFKVKFDSKCTSVTHIVHSFFDIDLYIRTLLSLFPHFQIAN